MRAPASEPPVHPPDRRFRVGELFHAISFTSMWSAGLVGALTVRFLGEPLAMGAQMWAAMNTEPRHPSLAFPTWTMAAFAALPLPFALRRNWKLAQLFALGFVAFPWVHFHSLYLLAGEP